MPILDFRYCQKYFHSVAEKILNMKLENLELNEEEKREHGYLSEDILLSSSADAIPVSIKISHHMNIT